MIVLYNHFVRAKKESLKRSKEALYVNVARKEESATFEMERN